MARTDSSLSYQPRVQVLYKLGNGDRVAVQTVKNRSCRQCGQMAILKTQTHVYWNCWLIGSISVCLALMSHLSGVVMLSPLQSCMVSFAGLDPGFCVKSPLSNLIFDMFFAVLLWDTNRKLKHCYFHFLSQMLQPIQQSSSCRPKGGTMYLIQLTMIRAGRVRELNWMNWMEALCRLAPNWIERTVSRPDQAGELNWTNFC